MTEAVPLEKNPKDVASSTDTHPWHTLRYPDGDEGTELREQLVLDASARGILVYHGRHGGDIEHDHFRDGRTFFATMPHHSHMYAEHTAICEDLDPDEAGLTIFPVVLTLLRPFITDRNSLENIARELLVPENKVARFCDNFEDSSPDEREKVFDHLQAAGFDGAILPSDLMPLQSGGDWQMQISYVAFEPQKQAIFALSEGLSGHPKIPNSRKNKPQP